jgi:hypothetical protein
VLEIVEVDEAEAEKPFASVPIAASSAPASQP